jgi:hypothetical protein
LKYKHLTGPLLPNPSNKKRQKKSKTQVQNLSCHRRKKTEKKKQKQCPHPTHPFPPHPSRSPSSRKNHGHALHGDYDEERSPDAYQIGFLVIFTQEKEKSLMIPPHLPFLPSLELNNNAIGRRRSCAEQKGRKITEKIVPPKHR